MPRNLDECVKSIKGTNKRTGKPYTTSEKFAICNAQLKKNKKAAFDDNDPMTMDDDVVESVEMAMSECIRHMLESKKANTHADAEAMCDAKLARSNFDPSMLWFVLEKEL